MLKTIDDIQKELKNSFYSNFNNIKQPRKNIFNFHLIKQFNYEENFNEEEKKLFSTLFEIIRNSSSELINFGFKGRIDHMIQVWNFLSTVLPEIRKYTDYFLRKKWTNLVAKVSKKKNVENNKKRKNTDFSEMYSYDVAEGSDNNNSDLENPIEIQSANSSGRKFIRSFNDQEEQYLFNLGSEESKKGKINWAKMLANFSKTFGTVDNLSKDALSKRYHRIRGAKTLDNQLDSMVAKEKKRCSVCANRHRVCGTIRACLNKQSNNNQPSVRPFFTSLN